MTQHTGEANIFALFDNNGESIPDTEAAALHKAFDEMGEELRRSALVNVNELRLRDVKMVHEPIGQRVKEVAWGAFADNSGEGMIVVFENGTYMAVRATCGVFDLATGSVV